MSEQYWWRSFPSVLGYDVGKKGNPSHCSIFAVKEDNYTLDEKSLPVQKLVMIHQKFLDGWAYTRQIEYLTACVAFFGVQRGYYDNTRAELEERNIPRQIIPVTLGSVDGAKSKSKFGLATNLAKLVEQKRIELIDDDRFISQVTCVTNDLQAANTASGHGDSFISIILAVGAFNDYFARDRRKGFSDLGDIQEMFGKEKVDLTSRNLPEDICKICKNKTFEVLPNGRKKCLKCYTIW
jgi:hypothetical protein